MVLCQSEAFRAYVKIRQTRKAEASRSALSRCIGTGATHTGPVYSRAFRRVVAFQWRKAGILAPASVRAARGQDTPPVIEATGASDRRLRTKFRFQRTRSSQEAGGAVLEGL